MTLEMLNCLIEIASINTAQSPVTQIDPGSDQQSADDELSSFIALLSSKNEGADILSKMKYRLALLSVAQKDPLKTEQLISANAFLDKDALPLMDFANWPAVRYAVSGELKTPESEAWFHRISAAVATIHSAIAEAERAKGTPSFHLLEKILALNSALPERYKAMANIQY